MVVEQNFASVNKVRHNSSLKHLFILGFGIVAFSWLLASCNQNSSQLEQKTQNIQVSEIKLINGKPDPDILAKSQILRKGNGSQPQTLDPHKGEGVPGSNIQRDLFEGLILESANGDLVPGVAESWQFDKANLTYTFKIRNNVLWSDGSPLTA